MDNAVELVFISVVVGVVVGLIIREAVCWYWKINRAIALLESIDHRLEALGSGDATLWRS